MTPQVQARAYMAIIAAYYFTALPFEVLAVHVPTSRATDFRHAY
ncbi:hypothetical protein FHW69_002339 [Luteibacter sp. Sphag1AF]|jgi:hypothetical protein|nr:hypothetical protein [Luteibacter sp. Sphag1AF]